jgi:hypothetical protein
MEKRVLQILELLLEDRKRLRPVRKMLKPMQRPVRRRLKPM